MAPYEGKEETPPRPEFPNGMSTLSSRRGNMEVRQALESAKFSGVTDEDAGIMLVTANRPGLCQRLREASVTQVPVLNSQYKSADKGR